jgi:hypothetical protein
MEADTDTFSGQPQAQVMLLGTFHFQDAGLDRYKPQHDADILSDQRQREVDEVVRCLSRFLPTKIAVERRPNRQAEIDREYRAYLDGVFQLPGSEVYQLSFRLARELGHDRVYCVDAWGRYYAPALDLEQFAANRTTRELQQFLVEQLDFDSERDLTAYARRHGQEQIMSQWWPYLRQQAEQGDRAKMQRTLRQHLLLCNTEAAILKSHEPYLVDWFKVGQGSEYPGVDWVTAWYNRNLRIFANMQRITDGVHERILLIIGGGHVPILRHCVQASPEYKLVEVAEYLTIDMEGRS